MSVAFAADSRYQQLAQEFDRLAVDHEAAITEIVELAIKQAPDMGVTKQQLTDQLRVFSQRPEVVQERIASYMRDFNESELEQALAVLRSPGYRVLQAKSFQARNPFYASLTKFKPSLHNKAAEGKR